jgi:conjugative relaxase-like TrwC/TraI family protein
MMTLNPAASLDYYLATAADAEGMPLLDGEANTPRVGYYQTKHDADPLARPGRWFGRMADSFGLAPGSAVDARTFANLYFGRTPDGKAALTDDMPSIREQVAASRAKAKAEAELAVAGQALSDARVNARRKGADIERDPGVLLARERLDKAKRERRSVSGEAGTRQPAHDLSFGAPKDVSLLLMALHAEGRTDEARRIEDAFRRSVEQTLEAIERDFLLDRPRDGEGNRTIHGIAGCAGALFLHFDARPVDGVTDPHLHAHALIFSPVATLDGEVRAVWTKYLSDNQHVLGAMQRALFASGLKALGYDIEPDIQKNVASFRLQGLDDRQRAGFSKRSLQVQAAQREGLTGGKAKRRHRATKFERLSGRDLIGQTAGRLRELGLDANAIASPQLETRLRRQIVQRMHREQQEELRGGLAPRVRVPGTLQWNAQVERRLADELRRLREPIPDTPETILESCLDMEACFSVRDIERKIWEAAAHADIEARDGETAEAATLRWGREMLETVLTHPDLLRVQYEGKGSGPQGLDPVGQPVFTTRKQRERETEVYGSILPALASACGFACIPEPEADKRIRAWETAQADQGKPIRLSDNQRQAVADLVTSSARLHVFSAWAGTGKTTMANAAVSIMKDMSLDVLAVAPSNAAAEGLRREIGASSALTPEALQLGLANGTVKLGPSSVVYVDEASMLDFKETRAMLLAVREAGARIVLQGDVRQLQAVGMGNVLKRVLSMPECQLGRRPRIASHLSRQFSDYVHIQRQREVWAKKVVAWAELGHVTKAFDELDRRGLVHRHAGEDDTLRAAVRSYVADSDSGRLPADIAGFHRSRVMIASTNTRVARLNELAREELKAQGLLGGQDWLVAASKGRCLRVALGERLIFTEKAGHGDVRIGDGGKQRVVKSAMGMVTAVAMRRGEPVLTLALDDGRTVEVDPRHFGGLDHAYALTVHKSQGMSVDRVEFVGGTFNNAELMLVALSRFKEKLTVHVAEHEVEAVRNSCARVTEKLEANDLHAIDLGFGTGASAEGFKDLARLATERQHLLNRCLAQLPHQAANISLPANAQLERPRCL